MVSWVDRGQTMGRYCSWLVVVVWLPSILFSHILGIIIPIDFHIFSEGWLKTTKQVVSECVSTCLATLTFKHFATDQVTPQLDGLIPTRHMSFWVACLSWFLTMSIYPICFNHMFSCFKCIKDIKKCVLVVFTVMALNSCKPIKKCC